MNELTMIWYVTGGAIGLVIASALYAFGGRGEESGGKIGKWVRRWVASFVLALVVNLLFNGVNRWSWLCIAVYPLLVVGFSMGYGADALLTKIYRRFVYGVFVCLSGVLCAVILSMQGLHLGWSLLVAQAILLTASMWVGIKNPIYAPVEEFFICMVLNLSLIMYPFIGA